MAGQIPDGRTDMMSEGHWIRKRFRRGSIQNRLTFCVSLLMWAVGGMWSDTLADTFPLPPDAAWPGDPDLAAFEDPGLEELYLATTVGLRTIGHRLRGAEFQQAMDNFRTMAKAAEDIEYIVAAAQEAAALGQWDRYRAALWCTETGVGLELRLVTLARKVLQAPREEKLSDARGLAIKDTLAFLGRSPCPEAAALLNEAITVEFWGSDPMRSRMLATETEQSLTIVRHQALANLGCLPSSLSLPLLEKLAQQYPNKSFEPIRSDLYRFEMGAGRCVAEKIYNVKHREGIPGAVDPSEEALRGVPVLPEGEIVP